MLRVAVLHRDSSPPQRRSNCNVHVLLGTSHTATPRKAWIFSQPQRKQSYGHTERLPTWLSSAPLQETWSPSILAKFLTLQNVSELKSSFQNEGSSPFNNPFSRQQLAPPPLLYSQPSLFWPLPRVFCSTDLTIPVFKEGVRPWGVPQLWIQLETSRAH